MQMFMDNSEVFLTDFDVFLQYIIIASTTILITPEENNKLKNFTKNKFQKFFFFTIACKNSRAI